MVVGCWLLVVGCWLLVVGCWLFVGGCWLLVVCCLFVVCCLLVVFVHQIVVSLLLGRCFLLDQLYVFVCFLFCRLKNNPGSCFGLDIRHWDAESRYYDSI